MPFFDFRCEECGLIYEKLIRNISTDLLHDCPDCKAEDKKQTRLVSAPKLFNGLPMGNGSYDKMNSTKPT